MRTQKRKNANAGNSKAAAPLSVAPARATPANHSTKWKAAVLIVGIIALAYGAYRVVQHYWGDSDYRKAQAALERRDFPQAREHLAAHLRDNPDDLPAHLLAAQTARRQADYAGFSRLLKEYESKNGVKERIGFEKELARVQQGDLAEAETLWAKCRTDPNSPDSLLMLEVLIEGYLKFLVAGLFQEMKNQGGIDASRFKRAEQAIGMWLERYPNKADQVQGFVWRGKLAGIARDYPRAQADFQRALDIDSNHFEARRSLASLLMLDSPAQAVFHLEVLYQRDPANQQVKFMLASAYRNLGRTLEAGRLLDELLDSDGANVPFLLERARACLDNRDPEQSLGFLSRIQAIAPNHPDALLVFSQCYQMMGKPEEARRFHDKHRELVASMQSKNGNQKSNR